MGEGEGLLGGPRHRLAATQDGPDLAEADAHCRTDEYALFQDDGFLAWFAGLGLERIGFREIRTVLRRRQAMARSAE
jgi:hypothetical protein